MIGVALAFLLLEVALRIGAPDWLEQRMRTLRAGDLGDSDSDLSWPILSEGRVFRSFVPGSKIRVRRAEYRHDVFVDELGGRATAHVADQTLVPVYGDSFTFGLGVEDSQTFLSKIAPRVPRRLLNLGVTGSALHNHLETLELRHDELGRPSTYLFVVYVGNDLANIQKGARLREEGEGAGRSILASANAYFTNHSQLSRLYSVQFVRQKVLTILHRGGRRYMEPVFLAMQVDRPDLDQSVALFAEQLDRLLVLSEELGFRAAFLLLPDVHQLDVNRRKAKALAYGIDPDRLDPLQPSEAIALELQQRHIPCLDIAPCLGGAETEGLYYLRDTHFTAHGHARAADCIVESWLPDWLAKP